MSLVIEMRGLSKTYGRTKALNGLNLAVPEGRILGLVGPNGAGKSTALSAMLGLIPCDGDLRVLGRDPWRDRERVMQDVSFIADVAVIPRWLTVSQALNYFSGVHPRFNRARAEHFLARTRVEPRHKVRELSTGTITQLNLALVMAIDARLLVLDEPTLGLDILVRKQFFDSLLTDYFDDTRTIIIATHQVDEVQDVLSDVAFIDNGSVVLESSMDDFASRYLEVRVRPEHVTAGRALQPMRERAALGRTVMLFDTVPRERLTPLGDVRTPGLADLYVAIMTPRTGAAA